MVHGQHLQKAIEGFQEEFQKNDGAQEEVSHCAFEVLLSHGTLQLSMTWLPSVKRTPSGDALFCPQEQQELHLDSTDLNTPRVSFPLAE